MEAFSSASCRRLPTKHHGQMTSEKISIVMSRTFMTHPRLMGQGRQGVPGVYSGVARARPIRIFCTSLVPS